MEHQITFYLVRHGEAENNVGFIMNSSPEIKRYPLTERGREQALTTAKFLATVDADGLFSSPILRAKQTADSIAQATGLPIELDERLCETGMGMFNGKTQKAFLEKYADPKMRISPDPADGVEGYIDMRARLKHFLDDMQTRYAGKKVIVVSHGDPLEQLHGILTNEAPGRSAIGWYPEKGSCTEVVWHSGH